MFQNYLDAIREQYLSDGESSEHTFRTALQTLLQTFADVNASRKLIIKHEPIKLGRHGRPDFKISTDYQLTIGLVETKTIGDNLAKRLDTEQLEKYRALSENIILTDYGRFCLIQNGEIVHSAEMFTEIDLKIKHFKLDKSRIAELSELLKIFFNSEPATICATSELATKLAEKALLLKEYAGDNLLGEQDDSNLLYGLYAGFKVSLLHEINELEFADIYAQTVSYSLFLASLNCDDPKTLLARNTAFSLLPNSFPLVRELFHRLDDFPHEILWAIDGIIGILKAVDFQAIKAEFSEYRHKEQGFNDPFIYFYEDFLKRFDKTKRELRGVYYTPEPAVSFIVRSIEAIIKDKFGIRNGLISGDVTLLDFAAGTGSFLLYAFKTALEQARALGDKQTVNKCLNEEIIKNFYGFELLVAPYVIAQLKISEFFKEQGLSIDSGNRLNIYLTDTLSNKVPKSIPGMPSVSKEAKLASETKNKKILAVIGNPPYSVSSQNKVGFVAEKLMNDYKDEVKGEKNIQPLSDDYIKFIRFANWKMEDSERGIVGVITNNSFLDGLIHRGMRKKLLKDFDDIYILNLHGNSRIGEKCPDGAKDENIFDIQQGVCISIFVKHSIDKNKTAKVYYKDLWGKRQSKFDYLMQNFISSVEWMELNQDNEYYFFTAKNFSTNGSYLQNPGVDKIFRIFTSGIKTHNDNELVSFEPFAHNNQKYNYRPFDTRYIEYDLKKVVRHRHKVMQYMLEPNIALIFPRSIRGRKFDYGFVSNIICDVAFGGRFTGSETYVAPLYIYQDNGGADGNGNGFLFKENGKRDNFTPLFRKYIKEKYKTVFTPEQILGYIYAVLYSPTYRKKYYEFLRIDFPRIPFTENEDMFLRMSELGSRLIDAHILNELPRSINCRCVGDGNNFKVEKVEFEQRTDDSSASNETGKVWFNSDRYFDNIPLPVWHFQIGGYQVMDKWLKDRKKVNKHLSINDITHFQNMTGAIDFTLKTMTEIDQISAEWI